MNIPEVTDVDMAFGLINNMGLPPYDTIPEEFKHGQTKWNKLVVDLFFIGLKSLTLHPKEGVDKDKAWRHVQALLRSMSSKHEHKDAGVSYLMSQYFEDAEWEANEFTP